MAWDKLLISADSHVVEPADLFASTLGDKHGDKVPRFVSEYQGVEGRYYFTGKEYLRLSVLLEGDDAEQDKLTKAGRDPGFRLQCLDEDGIYAEILYASSTLHTMRALDDQLVQDCCGVFSDWLADHRSEAPKRLFGCAPIHMADVNWAIAELERVAKLGMATATINCDTREAWEPYRSAHYDPFWARAEEIGMPLSLHILTGNERASFTLHGDERSQGVRRSLDVFHEAFPTLANEFIFGVSSTASPNSTSCWPSSRSRGWSIGCFGLSSSNATSVRRSGHRCQSDGCATIWVRSITGWLTNCISTRFSISSTLKPWSGDPIFRTTAAPIPTVKRSSTIFMAIIRKPSLMI